MKNNNEIKRTEYVLGEMVKQGLIYTGFPMTEENYQVDDAWLISKKHYDSYPLECKTICGGWCFKEDGEFRDYFKKDLPEKMRLECEIEPGTPIYYVNAEAKDGPSKWDKIVASGACLSILAADGIVVFSPRDLKDALIGYGYDRVTHTTEFGKTGERTWEKKAILNLEKGTFIPCTTPGYLLDKDNCNNRK